MNIEIIRYRIPIYWIGALINGDYTGISNEEAQEVDDFVKHADGCPVGVDWGTEGFYSYNDANAIGGTHVDDFPAEIRIFTDNGLICLSITSVYLSGKII